MRSPAVEAIRGFLFEVFRVLGAFLKECRTTEGIILLGYTLIILVHHTAMDSEFVTTNLKTFLPYAHERLIRKNFLDVVFFGFVALALVVFVQRQNPIRDYGLKLPEFRWTALTGGIFAIQLVGIVIAAKIPSLRDFYPMFKPAKSGGMLFWGFESLQLLSMVAWEFLNRGYLLLGLKPRFGMASVLIGVVPFGILHFGKPTLELYWSVFDGLGLALLAYASGSIWPAVWLHGVGALLLDVTLVYLMPP